MLAPVGCADDAGVSIMQGLCNADCVQVVAVKAMQDVEAHTRDVFIKEIDMMKFVSRDANVTQVSTVPIIKCIVARDASATQASI